MSPSESNSNYAYGSISGLGYGIYNTGFGLLSTYRYTDINWSFYNSGITQKGGADANLQALLTEGNIPYNDVPFDVVPGSTDTYQGPQTNLANGQLAVEFDAARVAEANADSLIGMTISTPDQPRIASPDMYNYYGGQRNMDYNYQTVGLQSGVTNTYVEVKTGEVTLSGTTGGTAGVQAPSDAINLRDLNAAVEDIRGVGVTLTGAGTVLLGGGLYRSH